MKYSIDEIITKLYGKCIAQSAQIRMLEAAVFGYISSVDPVRFEALKKTYNNNACLKAIEDDILASELKDEYLNYFSEEALRQALEILKL